MSYICNRINEMLTKKEIDEANDIGVMILDVVCIKKGNSKVLEVGKNYIAFKTERVIKKRRSKLNTKSYYEVSQPCYEICIKADRVGYCSYEEIGIYEMDKFVTPAEWRDRRINSIFE